jgi:hypothetical protein
MKNIMLNNGSNGQTSNQLDLGLDAPAKPRCDKTTARRRHSQASVWFRRMRQIVDSARDWQPAPPPRPVQPLLGQALSHERQLTE